MAATRIASLRRMILPRRELAATVKKVAMAQSLARVRAAKKRAQKIRDPYSDATLAELQELHDASNRQLEEALKNKKFEIAAALEKTLGELRVVIEEKRPWTRQLLDEKIEFVKGSMDVAMYAKRSIDSIFTKTTEGQGRKIYFGRFYYSFSSQ